LVNGVARRNVARTVIDLHNESQTLHRLVQEARIRIVGAMYDVVRGELEFLPEDEIAAAKRAVTSAD
jgi:carbonic anhydrase